jgi:hypothetical protein
MPSSLLLGKYRRTLELWAKRFEGSDMLAVKLFERSDSFRRVMSDTNFESERALIMRLLRDIETVRHPTKPQHDVVAQIEARLSVSTSSGSLHGDDPAPPRRLRTSKPLLMDVALDSCEHVLMGAHRPGAEPDDHLLPRGPSVGPSPVSALVPASPDGSAAMLPSAGAWTSPVPGGSDPLDRSHGSGRGLVDTPDDSLAAALAADDAHNQSRGSRRRQSRKFSMDLTDFVTGLETGRDMPVGSAPSLGDELEQQFGASPLLTSSTETTPELGEFKRLDSNQTIDSVSPGPSVLPMLPRFRSLKTGPGALALGVTADDRRGSMGSGLVVEGGGGEAFVRPAPRLLSPQSAAPSAPEFGAMLGLDYVEERRASLI